MRKNTRWTIQMLERLEGFVKTTTLTWAEIGKEFGLSGHKVESAARRNGIFRKDPIPRIREATPKPIPPVAGSVHSDGSPVKYEEDESALSIAVLEANQRLRPFVGAGL
jgi:hypothetical protein